MLKRFTATILILAAMLVMAPGSSAAATVIFTVLNDTLVGTPSKDVMPVKIGGQTYVPYALLSNLDLKTYYNQTLQRLMVYNFDYILTFDLARDETYDDTGVSYAYRAARRGGTIFVPINLVTQRFEMIYSVINSPLGQIVRVNTEKSYYRDIDILNDNKGGMQKLYDDYQKAQIEVPEVPIVNPPTTEPVTPPGVIDEPTARKIAYLAFDGGIGDSTGGILDSLKRYGYKASFFLTADDVLNKSDMVRRIYSDGHSIGVQCLADLSDEQAVLDDIKRTNDALKSVVYAKTRLLWMGGNSKNLTESMREGIIAAGMRVWDSNIEPKSDVSGAQTVKVNAINMMGKTKRSAVVRLRQNASAEGAIPGILAFIRSDNYTILPIREWDGPINRVKEMR